jgi:hypothetical protein
MVLASLNLAASNLAALASKLAPTSLGALIPAKLAAIPVVAGLVVGTAAGASFVAGPSYEPAAKAPQLVASTPAVTPAAAAPARATPAPAALPCEVQTWPYLDAKCMAGTVQEKRVRLVNAPRPDEATDAKAPLTTRDTVLRQPQNIDAVPEAKPAPRAKRSDTRRKRDRFATQAYQVPNAYGQSRPVIVVRPLRLDGR